MKSGIYRQDWADAWPTWIWAVIALTGMAQAANADTGSWHNAAFPQDIDGDGVFAPIDVLLIYSELTEPLIADPKTFQLPDVPSPPPFVDVHPDGFVSPLDLLVVLGNLDALGRKTPPLTPLQGVPEPGYGPWCLGLLGLARSWLACRRGMLA